MPILYVHTEGKWSIKNYYHMQDYSAPYYFIIISITVIIKSWTKSIKLKLRYND